MTVHQFPEARASYLEWYENGPYRKFVVEHRIGGEHEIAAILSRQPAGDYPDPPGDELAIIINAGDRAAPAVVDNGAGRFEGAFVPGSAVLSLPGERYECTVDREHVAMIVALPMEIVSDALGADKAALIEMLAPILRTEFHDRFLATLVRQTWCESANSDEVGRLFVDSASCATLAVLLRLAGQIGRHAGRQLSTREVALLSDFIEEQLAENLSLRELANLVGFVDGTGFSRAFSAALGAPPYQYVVQRRIARARHLLECTDDQLADIAYACGFSSQQHMTNVFTQKLGFAPGRYRRERRV